MLSYIYIYIYRESYNSIFIVSSLEFYIYIYLYINLQSYITFVLCGIGIRSFIMKRVAVLDVEL